MSIPLDRMRGLSSSPFAPRYWCDLGSSERYGTAATSHDLIELSDPRRRSVAARSTPDAAACIHAMPKVHPTPRHRSKFRMFVRCSLAFALVAIAIVYIEGTLPSSGMVPVAFANDRREETPSFGSRWTDRPIRQLDRSEITDLMRRGNELIVRGDLASARLVLQRAAEAGDPQAALILAETYDPVILARVGIQGFARDIVDGFAPNTPLARKWYQWAKELGSMEAVRRLEMLSDPESSTRAR